LYSLLLQSSPIAQHDQGLFVLLNADPDVSNNRINHTVEQALTEPVQKHDFHPEIAPGRSGI